MGILRFRSRDADRALHMEGPKMIQTNADEFAKSVFTILFLAAIASPTVNIEAADQVTFHRRIGSWTIECRIDRMYDTKTCTLFAATKTPNRNVVLSMGESGGVNILAPFPLTRTKRWQEVGAIRVDRLPPFGLILGPNSDRLLEVGNYGGPPVDNFINEMLNGSELVLRIETEDRINAEFSLGNFKQAYAVLNAQTKNGAHLNNH